MGNTYHVNDVWWTWSGCGGGGGARLQTCAIKHRVSFLLVKSSTVDLMNVWGPGYCWSAQWWSLVCYLNVEPSPHTSTSCPLGIIHMRGVPVFHRSTTSMYYTERNRRTKSGERPRNEAGKTEGYYRVNVVSHIIMWLMTEAFNRSISKTVSWHLLQLGTAANYLFPPTTVNNNHFSCALYNHKAVPSWSKI